MSVTISIAPMWEEIGWRGFAQPRMQRRYGPVVGTLILGALWGVWHLPFFFGPLARTGPDATFVSASIALVEFSIGLTGLSVVMAWVLNNCGGSTLMAILLHACFDSSGLAMVTLFPSTPPYYLPIHYQTLGIAIVFSAAALVLIIATRGDLGYSALSARGRLLMHIAATESVSLRTQIEKWTSFVELESVFHCCGESPRQVFVPTSGPIRGSRKSQDSALLLRRAITLCVLNIRD